MPRYLIEVPHDPAHSTCQRAVWAITRCGSHFLTHAEWGCRDGAHAAWLILELPTRADALQLVPPAFRADARVVELVQMSPQELERLRDTA